MNRSATPFSAASAAAHVAHYAAFERDPEKSRLAASWARRDTVDAWRHRRMHDFVNPLLTAFPAAVWLTVGDGRYGNDARYLLEKGVRAVASDISDAFLAPAQAAGHIAEYRLENAEALSADDNAFDFVLCKESYHHFARPMLALYEMLRVAAVGVFLIEPCETPTLEAPVVALKRRLKAQCLRLGLGRWFRTADTSVLDLGADRFEEAGNYVYTVSERELTKAVLGLNLPAVAFKGFHDYYRPGLETEPCTAAAPAMREVRARLARLDRRTARNPDRCPYGMVAACLFKTPPPDAARRLMLDAGFRFPALPRNPFVAGPAHADRA